MSKGNNFGSIEDRAVSVCNMDCHIIALRYGVIDYQNESITDDLFVSDFANLLVIIGHITPLSEMKKRLVPS